MSQISTIFKIAVLVPLLRSLYFLISGVGCAFCRRSDGSILALERADVNSHKCALSSKSLLIDAEMTMPLGDFFSMTSMLFVSFVSRHCWLVIGRATASLPEQLEKEEYPVRIWLINSPGIWPLKCKWQWQLNLCILLQSYE